MDRDLERLMRCETALERLLAVRDGLSAPCEAPVSALVDCYRAMFPHPDGDSSRVFLFVYLYAYDKSVLLGRRLKRNARIALRDILGANSPCTVSVRLRNLLFFYRRYPSFRRKADALYAMFLEKIKTY